MTLFLVTVIGFVTFFLGADTVTLAGETVAMATILPSPVDGIAAIMGGALLALAGLGWFLTFFFALYATLKAIFGDAWSYPGSFNVVG